MIARHDGEVYDEERIARDVSRMLPYLRDRMDHVRKPPARIFAFQESAISLRARYAEFGRDSGVNPGIMWPSKEELGRFLEVLVEQETGDAFVKCVVDGM